MEKNPFIVELDRGAVLSVAARPGTRVNCLQGTLWLTEDHAPGDVILEAGGAHTVASRGRAVVQAMAPARVAVHAPRAQPILAIPEPAHA